MPGSSGPLSADRFGDFQLTDAVRVWAPPEGVVPQEGYTLRGYNNLPCMVSAVSRERLFDVFLELLGHIAADHEAVDIVLETGHQRAYHGQQHRDIYAGGIDMWRLRNACIDHQDLLLNDGHTGVCASSGAGELQFTEEKVLVVYSTRTRPFRERLTELGIPFVADLRIVPDGWFVRQSSRANEVRFAELCDSLGVDPSESGDDSSSAQYE